MSTLTITLEPAVEKKAKRRAQKLHVSLEEFVGNAVKAAIATEDEAYSTENKSPMNGAELLAKWETEGVFTRKDMAEDTVEYVQRMRHQAEHRDWS